MASASISRRIRAAPNFPPPSLKAEGAAVPTADDALLHLAAHFARMVRALAGRGLCRDPRCLLARAAGLGTRIRARLAIGETVGVFEGIDDTGALILREGTGTVRHIAAGEVFFA
ncbi:MAG: hypothetical protein WDM81_20775 [Rhizomicrobium sp.]